MFVDSKQKYSIFFISIHPRQGENATRMQGVKEKKMLVRKNVKNNKGSVFRKTGL